MPVTSTWAQSTALSLPEAVTQALEHNRTLQVQSLEQQRAAQAVREARSYLRPVVTAAGSYLHYFDRQVIFLPGAFAGVPTEPVTDLAVGGRNAFSGAVAVSQPLLVPPARQRLKGALVTEQVAQEQTAQVRQETVRQVSVNYYQIQLLDAQQTQLRQRLRRQEQALRDAKSLLAQGRALRSDTLTAYVAVQNLRPVLAQLASDLIVAKTQLKVRLGLAGAAELVLRDSLTTPPAASPLPQLAEARELALQNRPDVKAQTLRLRLRQHDIAAARGERLPIVSAVGQYQRQAQADGKALTSYRWPATSFVGVQVAVPLFTAGRPDARVAQAETGRRQDELQLQQLQEDIGTELTARLAQAQNARDRWQLQAQNEEAVRISYGVIQSRYRQGLATRLEVTDAEIVLSQIRLQRVQTLYDLHVTQLELDYALGQLPR